MSYRQILANLNEGKIAPLYFASGADHYLYREFVGALRSAFQKRYGGNADLVQRWGADLKSAPDVSSLLGGGGLFSTASLIMLHEIQDAGAGVKTKLAELLGDLPPDTVVLVHYSVSDFRKAKWLDAMHHISQVVALTSPDGSRLPAMVVTMAQQRELKLNEEAIYRLIELSSGELAIIDNELEKLSLYLDEHEHIVSRNLVDRVAGAIENAHVSQFIDAIFSRDRGLAVQTLIEINHQGKEGLPYLVAMLYNGLIQLMALRETPEARKTISQGATSGYFLNKMGSVSKNYTMDELQKATRSLADLDLKFRLGSMDTLTAFTQWVSLVV
ncbi:MAG: DNA polymerase III subunit delta [Candidatus Marinimicrobia bacterium]|nr:DNA polymerase III subunit delta [Candidatus Neomarinimicrobiota bacterium]